MDTDRHELIHKELAYQIVGAAMEVHNTLGAGFLEKVHEKALMIALRKNGIRAQHQFPVKVLSELKTVDAVTNIHRAQAINHLKATGLRLSILMNFAKPKLKWERLVL